MSPVKIKIPTPEVLAERQRLEDERSYLASASEVRYQPDVAAIELLMQSGAAVQIPLKLIDELAGATPEALREVSLAVGGDAISVPSMDVDIAIPGLIRDVFGLNFQRLGGLAKSAAKAAAARANGAKGGRPQTVVPSSCSYNHFAEGHRTRPHSPLTSSQRQSVK